MAKRPVFVPDPGGVLVAEHEVRFEWHGGFALAQKRRNVDSLHRAVAAQGMAGSLLEVSSRSDHPLGRHLSAFNLEVPLRALGRLIPLESAFQGSKVFEASGHQPAIYSMAGRDAKRAARAYDDAGELLVEFNFEGESWPLEPKTAFYDWLYLRALLEFSADWRALADELAEFAGFTDLEFNPKRSFNCQARSCALFVALAAIGDVQEFTQGRDAFLTLLAERGYGAPPGSLL